MKANPFKKKIFWTELKRRKVFRSLAIYAGTAFIILEATTIIFPRWGLPDWTIDLVLYLLILGAFANAIIAWFYDITPGGMQRTRSPEEAPAEERIPGSRGWKALDELEKALRERNPNLPYIGTGTRFEALHDSSRFLAILDCMHLPYPVKQ